LILLVFLEPCCFHPQFAVPLKFGPEKPRHDCRGDLIGWLWRRLMLALLPKTDIGRIQIDVR